MQRKVKAFNQLEKPHFKDCGAAGNQIVFYPNGEIGVCQAYLGCREHIIGNIKKDFKDPPENIRIKNNEKME